MSSASAACRSETQAYRKCLQDSRNSGASSGGTKKCQSVALTMENCRERWRRANDIHRVEFDGTRILPNHKCRPLNTKVQHCLKWKQGDESQCRDEIQGLNNCMATEKGEVTVPTEGDKVWSDYKERPKKGRRMTLVRGIKNNIYLTWILVLGWMRYHKTRQPCSSTNHVQTNIYAWYGLYGY
jgi:hypothetical protein